MGPAPEVSVILPTVNESLSLSRLHDPLLSAIDSYRAEVIVVDDASKDGTVPLVEGWARDGPFRLLERSVRGGLASAVLDGIRHARGRAIVVMDADGSHEPRSIPSLVDPVLEGRAELVLGCRTSPSGSAPGLTWERRFVSQSAALLARPLTSVRDPMSGFFAVAPSVLGRAELTPVGFKIALEILVRCDPDPTLEVPIRFVRRTAGESKLGVVEVGRYVRHLSRLYRWRVSGRGTVRTRPSQDSRAPAGVGGP